MHVNTLHKTTVLVKPGHILWRKCPLVFPLMSYDCSVCSLLLSGAVLNNDLLLQLQLQSAGSLHVAFRISVNHRVEAEQS